MDEQQHIVKEDSLLVQPQETVSPNRSKSTLRNKLDTIFLILFGVVIFCVVFAGVYYLGTGKSILPQVQIATQPTGVTSMKELPEVTQKTQIAKSLIPPPPYKDLQWQDVTKTASPDGNLSSTAEITANNKSVSVDFPVLKIYQSSVVTPGAKELSAVTNYYGSQLGKLGWVSSSNHPYLTFKTFHLDALMADGPCGNKTQFLGYQNGQIRLISVIHEAASSCTRRNQVQNMKIKYTVFISKPLTLQYITNYIHAHFK